MISFDKSVTARVSTLIALLVPLLRSRSTRLPLRPFQRFDDCIYEPQCWDDGDSFHVILPDRKEVIFRLYFVDTPEEERFRSDPHGITRRSCNYGFYRHAASRFYAC